MDAFTHVPTLSVRAVRREPLRAGFEAQLAQGATA